MKFCGEKSRHDSGLEGHFRCNFKKILLGAVFLVYELKVFLPYSVLMKAVRITQHSENKGR
jgi:hypothetical protein